MISFFCNRCSQLTISVEGLHCFYCDQDIIRSNEITGNLYLHVPELENTGLRYYETVADVNTRKFARDLMLSKPSTEISNQTADDGIKLPKETSGKIRNFGDESRTKSNCSTERETFLDLKQDSIIKRKRISGTSNTDQENFHQKTGERNPHTERTFLQLTNGRSLASQKWKHTPKQSAVDRFENNRNSVGMLKTQEIVEPTKHINEATKLNFEDSIVFQPENPPLSLHSESSKNFSEQAIDNIDGFFSPINQKNSERKDFQRNSVATNTAAEKKAQTSDMKVNRTCEKCGRFFIKDSTFYAHIQSNCDPKPFKCDICGAKFRDEYPFEIHQRIHTRLKCNHCDFVTFNRRGYNAHMKLHTEQRLLMNYCFRNDN